MDDNSKILLATITGAAIGAGAALLLAPASGKETRQNIVDKYEDVRDSAREGISNAKDSITSAKDKLATKAQESAEKAKS